MKQAVEEERGSETGVFSDSWSPGKCGQASGGREVQPDWPFLHFFAFHTFSASRLDGSVWKPQGSRVREVVQSEIRFVTLSLHFFICLVDWMELPSWK